MESWLRPLSVRCTRGFSRLEMQRSFARTSSAHSTLAKVVQSISRCTNTCDKKVKHIIQITPALKLANKICYHPHRCQDDLHWLPNFELGGKYHFSALRCHWENCVMRHFQEFLLAIDVASFGPVYISQWNTQGKTPVGFQVLFPEINWKWSITTNFYGSGDVVKINYKDIKCTPLECMTWTEMVWSTRTVWQRLCSRWTSEYMRMHIEANHRTNMISFSCDTCGKTSRSRHGLKLHKAREHSSSFQDQRWFAAAQKRKKLDSGHWKWPKIVNL